jgi:hypothetical protein
VRRLAEFRPDVLVTQKFHSAATGFGADTAEAALEVLAHYRWTDDDYRDFVARLRDALPLVHEAEEGFFPPPWPAEAVPPA